MEWIEKVTMALRKEDIGLKSELLRMKKIMRVVKKKKQKKKEIKKVRHVKPLTREGERLVSSFLLS
jgi:predicted Zn-ribbon and HTH transcriptional regulator